jgi:hypothetical protein
VTGDTSIVRWDALASACTKVGFLLIPPSTRTEVVVSPESVSADSRRSVQRCAMP